MNYVIPSLILTPARQVSSDKKNALIIHQHCVHKSFSVELSIIFKVNGRKKLS